LKPPDPDWRPPHAYLPGQTARHPEELFAAFHYEIRPGLSPKDLAESRSWAAGWSLMQAGYGWEAHEVLEPVWMALPDGSAEKIFVQAVIQGANATVKARMGRGKAALRLCEIARGHVSEIGGGGQVILGRDPEELLNWLERVEAGLTSE
tara:strand:- start:10290 stop:10739 length:450 start_codon:yes stop_codon:yes gene_type:complete